MCVCNYYESPMNKIVKISLSEPKKIWVLTGVTMMILLHSLACLWIHLSPFPGVFQFSVQCFSEVKIKAVAFHRQGFKLGMAVRLSDCSSQ